MISEAMLPEDTQELVAVQDVSFANAGEGVRHSWPKEKAMGADALAAFLASKHYAVLATARPDCRPQATPIAFFVSGGSFWFATVPGARLRNVRRTPYGSVVISEGEGEAHRVVVAEGPIEIHERSSELDVEWEGRHGTAPTWAAAFLELRPERFFSFASAS